MIVSFINLKGGCAKSTSAVHLSRWLLSAEQGSERAVALIDTDPLVTSSSWIEHLEEDIAQPKVFQMTDPQVLLQELPRLVGEFNTIVIDSVSGSIEIQQAILQAVDLGLIPLQPSILDISATHQTLQAVRHARQVRRNPLKAFTFLVRVTPKSILLEEAQEILQSYQDIPLLSTTIPQRQVVADAMGQNKTLFDYKGDRNATAMSRCYEKLFKEAGLR
ncbi:MAG: hypothetical protein ACRC8A_07855 [Microcoleaceae cyanobacterium]